MASPTQDPTGSRTDTADPGLPPQDSPDGSVVDRTKYEADIAEERRRRAGQERAHRKELDAMKSELDAVKALLVGQSQSQSPVQLPDLNPNDPTTPHIQHLYQNTRQWQDAITARERAAEVRARLQEAITEATSQGVPTDVLDESSPESVRASAKEYLSEKRIRDLEDRLAKSEKDKEQIATQTRAEGGQLTVSTATGGRTIVNPDLASIQTQKADLEKQKARAIAKGGPAAMTTLAQVNRDLKALDAQEQALLAGSRR